MTSAKKVFRFSALPNLQKEKMRTVIKPHPESLYSRMIGVYSGGLSVE
ncbi:MAG: hypothetical protein RBR74_03815 [Ignavibacteriaceae bacterium]|jgi:hypothetical protein|nr:hypothetical protein [Ignavibacteriaceae bacterium]